MAGSTKRAAAAPAAEAAAAPRTAPAVAESAAEDRADSARPVGELGARLKQVRMRAGLSLRAVARQLGVSPSFVSQLENGKSQPSVATLYSISQLLDVSIDQLFLDGPGTAPPGPAEPASATPPARPEVTGRTGVLGLAGDGPINRSALGSPANAWDDEHVTARLSVTRPGVRRRLEMDSGVVWEQLATNTGTGLDFIEIIYPPHSTSTSDNRMLQHAGSEFGYMIEGELEITVGFDVVTLRAGDALGFDSSMPHRFSNLTDVPARGIWFVRHPHV
jgi:transcriptional regulator with XRE-family HTH domain/mannose-6-phosphate isomerase-like protein (cupin superfamily)